MRATVQRGDPRGSALLVATIFLIVIMGLTAAMSVLSLSAVQSHSERLKQGETQRVLDSALAAVMAAANATSPVPVSVSGSISSTVTPTAYAGGMKWAAFVSQST